MMGDVGRRGRRAIADVRHRIRRRGSATSALAVFDARRRDREGWRRVTAERHDAYRQAHPPADGTLAMVCVTGRPHRLDALVANASRQEIAGAELIIVTNAAGYDDLDVAAAASGFDGAVTVLGREPEVSLGHCLNAALDATHARFIAKMDDDDVYGAAYLTDSLRAHRYAGAGVVGKHTYYAWFDGTDETVLRFPDNEFRYSSTLAGGTLVIDRERTGDLRFEDRSLGEDRAFIADCHRRGVSTFSADRFNFTQTRSDDNEWTVGRDDFLRRSEIVGPGWHQGDIDR